MSAPDACHDAKDLELPPEMATTSPSATHRLHGHHAAGVFKPLDDEARAKVKAQIEFYFSDSNLPRDKFLRETVEADPDGYVDIALLVTFSRLRALLAAFGGPHNEETIADVTKLLETSEELMVSEDKKRIRRKTALRPREEVDAEVEQRSVYASPFPMTATIDDLTEFFGIHSKVLSIRLRRHITSKDFKGRATPSRCGTFSLHAHCGFARPTHAPLKATHARVS